MAVKAVLITVFNEKNAVNSLMKKNFLFSPPRTFILSLILIFSIFIVSYLTFVKESQQLNPELFNWTDTVSWRKTEGNFVRVDAKAQIENVLLSNKVWDEFNLSLTIVYPRDCGLVYRYQDAKNFHFIIFDVREGAVLWGFNRDGAYAVVKKIRSTFSPILPCRLMVTHNRADLFLNHQPHSSFELNGGHGRIGLMSRTVSRPPTVFTAIAIEDQEGLHQESGIFDLQKVSSRFLHYLIATISLNGIMIFLALHLSRFYFMRWQVKGAEGKEKIGSALTTRGAASVHFLLALFLFWPFFVRGEILASSSDNIGQIFPLFIFSKHNFQQILEGQSFGLWNPYAHNGIPFFSNHWNMLYYPLNWPLFFLPDQWVLMGVTFRLFLEVFFIGILSYQFFRLELGTNSWALFCSVTYQLCSLLIFSLTIFPTTSMIFSLTLYLYVVWSMNNRSFHWNFIWLTLSLTLFLTSANMAFTFYGGLVVVVLTVYRLASCLRQDFLKWQHVRLVVASFLLAFFLTAIRVIPCVLGVMDSNRLVEDYYTLHDRSAMLTRLFLPEIVGWLGQDFLNALTESNLNLIFRDINLPSNSQNTFFVYGGVLTALLFVLGLLKKNTSGHFWKIYTLLALALGLMIQPFWGLFNILFFPFNHYSYYIIIIPIGLCTMAGYTLRAWEKQGEDFREILPQFIFIILFIQMYILVFVTYLFPKATIGMRVTLIVMVLWYGYYFLSKQRPHNETFLLISAWLVMSLLWAVSLVVSTMIFINPIPKRAEAFSCVIIPVTLFLIILVATLYFYSLRTTPGGPPKRNWTILFWALPFIIYAIIVLPLGRWIEGLSIAHRNYFLDTTMGEIKFLLIVFVVVALIIFYATNRISQRGLFIVMMIVILWDLIAFNARFDNVVAPTPYQKAFYPFKYPYRDIPPQIKKDLDFVNYRAHYLHEADLHANKNLIFEVPTYTGIMGHMPKRFANFIVSFGYPKETVLIYPEESTDNERFLDLCAVRYKFLSPTQWETRPTALSRLMLFYHFEVRGKEEEVLAHLKNPTFDPLSKVLLSENFLSHLGERKDFKKINALSIPITQNHSDEVTATVRNPWPEPGILLFNETYAPGWKAYIDETVTPIVIANYAFMACVIPSGQHSIRFRYEPEIFAVTRNLSLLGLMAFLSGVVVLRFRKKRQ